MPCPCKSSQTRPAAAHSVSIKSTHDPNDTICLLTDLPDERVTRALDSLGAVTPKLIEFTFIGPCT
jgi:hypothetical protein